ncbi:MAG: undecaprenyldiphospho-muramoylpentapeptide beta-N-acetylglucosaminyltransferase [Deltaproteobacteria bacterium]|nr:undecaprenyldiphospho-muramoylpentapeptide beta-N-acetylglucosaminyltransferase [Deltaproteobacteria bacterium]
MRVVFAGGGTGGHLFPGIAIAQEFMKRDPNTRILFIGTGKPLEVSVLADHGFAHQRISTEGIIGRKWWQKMRSILKLPAGILKSAYLLLRFQPQLAVGLGGYSAAPVVAAAWLMRKRIVLQEQNIVPGITNRMLAPLADRIYVSFEETATYFRKDKVRFTGNPIRTSLLEALEKKSRVDSEKQLFTVMILGGSQGAHSINVAMAEALVHLKQKDRYHFIHQTGIKDEAFIKERYRQQKVSAEVQAFFQDIASVLQKVDLVICRAGATTVAEITALALPAILIPFPFAADNHQVLNARELEKKGAAEVVLEPELNGRLLADRINYYFTNPQLLRQMAERAKWHAKPEAAKTIVDDSYRLMAGNG